MALDQKFFKKSTTGSADQEQGLTVHIDANDVDSYDGDGSIWYDIAGHDVNIPLADKASNLQLHLNASDTTSYSGSGATWTDISGNDRHGTITDPVFESGLAGGLDFNSATGTSGDKVVVAHNAAFNQQNNMSFEVWLKRDGTTEDNIFYKGGAAGNSYFFTYNPSWGYYFYSYALGGGTYTGTSGLSAGVYEHVVITIDGSGNRKIYVNGNMSANNNVHSATGTGTLTDTGPLTIGGYYTYAAHSGFGGEISVVRIYNTVLTAAEVGQNYRAGNFLSYSSIITSKHEATQGSLVTAPPVQGTLHTSNLGFHLDANGHSGTYWTDSANNINGTINGATYVNDNNSDYFTFDGSDDTVTFPASDTSPINFSSETHAIEFWVNFNNLANDDVILGKFGGSNTTKSFQIQVSSTNKLTVLERDGGSNNTFETTGTFSTGTWTHFIYARSASQVILYINGALDSTHSASNAINAGSTQDITIGNQAGASVYFDGKLAQLRIYSSTLDSSQVLTNYNATKDLYQGVTSLQLSLDANGYTSGAWSNTANSSYNATVDGATYTNDSNSDYFDFDGSNDYAEVSAYAGTDIGSGGFTIEAWALCEASSGQDTIVSNIGSNLAGYQLYIDGGTDVKLYMYSGGANYWILGSASSAVTVGTWNHYVVTVASTLASAPVKVYVNGVEKISTNLYASANYAGANHGLDIGRYPYNNSKYFEGKIAQVRTYNGAMTVTQVNTNYNATKALYQNPTIEMNLLGSAYTSGATWSDSSGKGNNGSISGTPGYDQELGDYLNFSPGQTSGAGTSSTTRLTVSSFSALQTATAFTIEFWLKSSTASSDGMIWNVYDSSSSTRKFSLSWNNSKFRWVVYSASGGYNASQDLFSTNTFSTNTWYHIVATYNYNTEMKIYVDGVLEGAESNPNLGVNTTTTTQMRIGDRSDGYAVDTQVGQARFYTGALTQAQIVQNYLATKNKYPNGHNATINGSPTWGTNSNPAYNYFGFDSNSEYLTIPDSSFFDLVSNQSMELWLYRIGTGAQHFINKAVNSASNYGWQFFWQNGNYYFQMHNAPYSAVANVTVANTTVNTWLHLVLTAGESKEWKLYIDATLGDTQTVSGTVAPTTADLHIGRYSLTSTYGLVGRIGMIKFYDKTLSATEVTAARNNTKGNFGL